MLSISGWPFSCGSRRFFWLHDKVVGDKEPTPGYLWFTKQRITVCSILKTYPHSDVTNIDGPMGMHRDTFQQEPSMAMLDQADMVELYWTMRAHQEIMPQLDGTKKFRAIPGNVEDHWSMLKREPHDVFRGRMLSCRSLKLLATGTCAPSTGAPRLRRRPSPSWLLPHYTGESNPNQQYLFQNLSARCFSGQLLHVVTKNQTSNMSHAVFHSRDRLQQKVRCPFNQPWELNSKSWVWIDVSGRDLVALQL